MKNVCVAAVSVFSVFSVCGVVWCGVVWSSRVHKRMSESV
jgi:hypothetical protein